jgi:hypothetical protein
MPQRRVEAGYQRRGSLFSDYYYFLIIINNIFDFFWYAADEWKRGMDNENEKKKSETGDNGWSWGANKHAKYDQRSG